MSKKKLTEFLEIDRVGTVGINRSEEGVPHLSSKYNMELMLQAVLKFSTAAFIISTQHNLTGGT